MYARSNEALQDNIYLVPVPTMRLSIHCLSALLLARGGLAVHPAKPAPRALNDNFGEAAGQLSRRQSVWDGSNIQVVGQDGLDVTTLRPEHNKTGVDAAHGRGLFGEGVKIGVLETNFRLDSPGLSNVTYTVKSLHSDDDAVTIDTSCVATHGTEMLGTFAARDTIDGVELVGVAPNADYQLLSINPCNAGLDLYQWEGIFGTDVKGTGLDIVQLSYSGSVQDYPESK